MRNLIKILSNCKKTKKSKDIGMEEYEAIISLGIGIIGIILLIVIMILVMF